MPFHNSLSNENLKKEKQLWLSSDVKYTEKSNALAKDDI